MRRSRSLSFVVALMAAAFLLPAGADATSHSTEMSLRELVAQADFVFSGKVESLASEQDAAGQIWTLYTFSNVQPIVGTTDGDTFALRCMGGEYGDIAQIVHGTPRFQQGDEMIVFFRAANAVCQIAGWVQGAFFVVQNGGQSALVTDEGRFVVGADENGIRVGQRKSDWVRNGDAPAAAIAQNATPAAAAVDSIKSAIAGVAQSIGKRSQRAIKTTTIKGRPDAFTAGVAP